MILSINRNSNINLLEGSFYIVLFPFTSNGAMVQMYFVYFDMSHLRVTTVLKLLRTLSSNSRGCSASSENDNGHKCSDLTSAILFSNLLTLDTTTYIDNTLKV